MKKLAVFFIVLISLIIAVGCNQSEPTEDSPMTTSENGVKTTVKKLEEEKGVTPPEITMKVPLKEPEKEDNTESEPVNTEKRITLNGREDLASTGNNLSLWLSLMMAIGIYSGYSRLRKA